MLNEILKSLFFYYYYYKFIRKRLSYAMTCDYWHFNDCSIIKHIHYILYTLHTLYTIYIIFLVRKPHHILLFLLLIIKRRQWQPYNFINKPSFIFTSSFFFLINFPICLSSLSSLSCNLMPCSGCLALHRVNTNEKYKKSFSVPVVVWHF